MKHYTIIVSGKVQGVFFRSGTQEQANRLNIRGWVRNEADGSVRIEAEGEEADLRQLIDWCHRGPLLARVENVTTEVGTVMHYADFTVQR